MGPAVSITHSQVGWQRIAGEGQAPYLLTLSQVDELHYYAAGFGGTLLSTSDGGTTWKKINTGTVRPIRGAHFTDAAHGTIVGDSGLYQTTTDGGDTWQPHPGHPFTSQNHLAELKYSDPDRAILLGTEGHIFTTSDAGATWNAFDIGEPLVSFQAAAFRGNVGIVGGTGGRMYVTTDAGSTWNAIPLRNTLDLYDVWITDQSTFFAAGDAGVIQKSTDGGVIWSTVADLSVDRISLLYFTDASHGYAAATQGDLYRTGDGGATWFPDGSHGSEVGDCRVTAAGPGVMVMLGKRPVFTTDGGASWSESRIDGYRYNGVHARGPDTVMVVGDRGLIIRSTDAGVDWTTLTSGTSLDLHGVNAYGGTSWTVVGDSGLILRSTDAGGSWSRLESGSTRTLRSVDFPTLPAGWVVGDSGTVLRTLNTGATWVPLLSYPGNLFGVDFTSVQYGFVVGDGRILRTSNSGNAWFNVAPPQGMYRGVTIDAGGNVIVGGSYTALQDGQPSPLLQSSSNAGNAWRSASGLLPGGGIFSVASNPDLSAAVGAGGRIYRSTNSGFSWNPRHSPVTSTLRGVSFSQTTADGYAVGDEGVILRTSDGGGGSPPSIWDPPAGAMIQPGPSFTLSWSPLVELTAVQAQVSTDPTFLSGVIVDTLLAGSTYSLGNIPLARSGRFFWRVRGTTAAGTGAWSQTMSFYTRAYGQISVSGAQYVDSYYLQNADYYQNSNPVSFWVYQGSPVGPRDTVRMTGVCSVPADVLSTGAGITIHLSDQNASASRWGGILVDADSLLSERLSLVREGDLISIDATVRESPPRSMNSATVATALSVRVLGTNAVVPPVRSWPTDHYRGSYPGGRITFSGGEPLEGMIVQMEDLVVESILDPAAGTFSMTDRAGNSIQMTDISKWFTNRDHRDPASTYEVPRVGDHIDTIRGIVTVSDGPHNDRGYAIAPVYPGDLVVNPHSAGTITGAVYIDTDGDGRRDPGEGSTGAWPVRLSGGELLTAYPNGAGVFRFIHLDSAAYHLTAMIPNGWRVTEPSPGSYIVPIASDDSAGGRNFGVHYDGSVVTGIVFYDENSNGARENGEPGLASWPVTLAGTQYTGGSSGLPLRRDTVTDSEGFYRFNNLPWGSYSVSVPESLYWFQLLPDTVPGYPVEIGQSISSIQGRDFGLVRQVKLKLGLEVSDQRAGLSRRVAWGVVPGASAGIWRVSAASTLTDTLEGEYEIPPRGFAQFVGMLDARFSDPAYPPGTSSPLFGEGGWTDVRDFRSASQSDTFLLSFLPSYIGGGGYPMRLKWSSRLAAQSFNGQVLLRDGAGGTIDMKTSDHVIVSDPSIFSYQLIAMEPKLPESWIAQWRLVSLPVWQGTGDYRTIFPSAAQSPYAFIPGIGYEANDIMTTGKGYWLKHRRGMDPPLINPGDYRRDTIEISEGWNLVPASSRSLLTSGMTTIPPGILAGPFFGYGKGYSVVNALQPGNAYWVAASRDGSLLLTGSGTENPEASTGNPGVAPLMEGNSLEFVDAAGRSFRLYLSDDSTLGDRRYQLPPTPPAGCFDIRTATNSIVEIVPPTRKRRIPIIISGAAYPLSIRWEIRPETGTLAIFVGGYSVPVRGEGSAEITDPSAPIILSLNETESLPAMFTLDQNYPNPFNPMTTIRYGIPGTAKVSLKVFDILGRELESLVDELQGPGYRTVTFNAGAYPSGIYFYKLTAGDYSTARKMMLVR